jgi:hypothetical protein
VVVEGRVTIAPAAGDGHPQARTLAAPGRVHVSSPPTAQADNATLGADFFTYLEHHPENADAQSVIDAVAGHEGGQGPQQKSRRREQTRQPARADQQTNPNGLADEIIEATVPHAGSGVTDNETNTILTQENEETHDRPHKSRW